jgi:hypothetical protein
MTEVAALLQKSAVTESRKSVIQIKVLREQYNIKLAGFCINSKC